MRFKVFGATLFAAGILGAPAAQAQTEIQWWHSMGGALGEKLNELANKFNASQKEYKVVPVYKGSYPESMTAAIAAFRAGNAPHLLQVFEVGTATMMAAKGAIVPVAKVMARRQGAVRPEGLPADGDGLLHRPEGQHAVVPLQQLDGDVLHQQGRLQEGGPRPGQGAEDLEGVARRGGEAEGGGPGLRLHHQLAVLDAHRELQRLAQRADRHQAERHGRLRHRVHHQLAAARAPHRDARRHGEEGPVHLRRPHQPGRRQVLQRRVRDVHRQRRRAGGHPAGTPSSTGRSTSSPTTTT